MHSDETSRVLAESEQVSTYETPVLRPIGNLHDVVASTTQHLACDGGVLAGDGGEHNPGMTGC
jgi:hypothetical protein